MRITADQAGARVLAGLGRHPQDALEAAVVLEAWGGLTARTSLPLASGAVRGAPAAGEGAPPRRVRPVRRERDGDDPRRTREVLGLLATLLATTAWFAPLSEALGRDVAARSWALALPLALGAQWALRRRHLSTPGGLGRLRRDRPLVVTGALLALLVPPGLLVAPELALPGALLVTWVGGMVVVVRGWGLPYAGALVLATAAAAAGVPAVLDVLAVVLVTAAAVVAAVGTLPVPKEGPVPWGRSLLAGALGAGTALLVVLDPAVEWSGQQPFPVVALLPSLLGGLAASRRLDSVWTVLVAALAVTTVQERAAARPRLARVFARIVAGATARLLLVAAVCSALLLAVLQALPGPGAPVRELVPLLAGLAAFGLVGFLAGLLETFTRAVGAVLVVAAALAGSSAAALTGLVDVVPGLLVAAAAASAAALVPLARLVRHPDRTLATAL
ncbi:hypothetical protein [Kineococcus terrestris]|uniref:hypothetical protein n=1 Tax=Kineococcus terrestris TaxID=2044856 RepID=UPI0034DAF270